MKVQTSHSQLLSPRPQTVMRKKRNQLTRRFISYAVLVIGAAIFLIPLIWTLLTALTSSQELGSGQVSFFPRDGLHWENFLRVFSSPGIKFPTYLKDVRIIIRKVGINSHYDSFL